MQNVVQIFVFFVRLRKARERFGREKQMREKKNNKTQTD